jgi:aerobic carbon-monoxide dehydrogenase medium subunit
MIPAPFEYVRARSLEDAVAALAEPDAKVLAGGQSLVSVLKLRLVRPSRLVDIGALELRSVLTDASELRIGALSTWDDLVRVADLERPALRALSECAAGIGDLQVRNRGTAGGSLAHADPASDLPPVTLALGATFLLAAASGERSVPAAEFFHGPFLTALDPQEVLTEIRIPLPPRGSGSAYVKIEHPASGFALAGAAALVLADGKTSVGLTGVAAQPLLVDGDLAAAPIFGDLFAPEEYRRHLAEVVVRRALERARAHAGEDRTWTA